MFKTLNLDKHLQKKAPWTAKNGSKFKCYQYKVWSSGFNFSTYKPRYYRYYKLPLAGFESGVTWTRNANYSPSISLGSVWTIMLFFKCDNSSWIVLLEFRWNTYFKSLLIGNNIKLKKANKILK